VYFLKSSVEIETREANIEMNFLQSSRTLEFGRAEILEYK
jgi:hypothetical protein